MRTGLPFSYWTETWVLESGRSQATLPALADAVQFAAQPVGEHDRRRHQLRRFVAGEAEHQSLVAGALLGRLLALGGAGIDPLGDVRALARDQIGDEHLVGVKDIVVIDVADVGDGIADDVVDVDLGLGW